MSKRIFLSTILWLIVVNLIIKAIFIFGVDIRVQLSVGPSSYGIYFTLLNLCYIFQIVNDFGLNLLHNTDTAVHGKVRVERWYQILRLKIILALFYSSIIALTAWALGYGDEWRLLIWLVLNNILVSMILVFRAGISGMGHYRWEAMISVMDKALMVLICGFLLFRFTDFQMQWFVWAQTASLVITIIVALLISLKFIDRSPTSVTLTPMVVVFKDTLPFTLATLLMFIYTRSDSILIDKLLTGGSFQVGIYAAGYRLLDAANMIAYLFSPLLIPMYARLMKDKTETIQLLRLSSGMMVCMSGFIGFAGFWWGMPIMTLLYKNVTETWIFTFRLLILSHIPIGLMYIFGSYLTAVTEMKKQNILFVCSVVISIGLNLYLIPLYGPVGAAITALITQTFTTTGLILLVQNHLRQKIDINRLVNFFFYFFILGAGGWLLSSGNLPWMFELAIFLFVAVFAGFLLKILKWDSFMELMRNRTT